MENQHSNEIEVFKRKYEITEIQKALSDSHLAIYDEKNTVNGLRLRYEDLLKVEKGDMRRIKELRALNQDVSTKAANSSRVNVKDCRPDSSKKNFPLSKTEKAMKNGTDARG